MSSFKVAAAVLALAVVALAQHHNYQQHYAPIAVQEHLPIEHHVEEHYYAHPKYEYKYGVHDPHTHDIKEQAEKRDGDKVEGYYKLVEPDGTTRTVHYTSDKHSGFNAHVERSGHAVHPVVSHGHGHGHY